MVLKPSELTPLTALALAELAERAGVPRGVFNVVVGDARDIGDALVKSDTVRKIGFTGSTRVGMQLMAGAAPTMKRISLELGGNAPFIIFPDADVQRAAALVSASSNRNGGQTCICTNRVFVHVRDMWGGGRPAGVLFGWGGVFVVVWGGGGVGWLVIAPCVVGQPGPARMLLVCVGGGLRRRGEERQELRTCGAPHRNGCEDRDDCVSVAMCGSACHVSDCCCVTGGHP